jgi:glycosyltransferase involved in cell wall biosynthesis
MERLGVSIVICCHNSARLLPKTLSHLKSQRVPDQLSWEVVVVDNASTDDTGQVARSCWAEGGPVSLRVIRERRLGLSYARERGFQAARYGVVSFIDDDNWATTEWVALVSEVMSSDPNLGAIGSINRAVADVPFPSWFVSYCEYYASWASRESAQVPVMLNGAGMTIRKATWQDLKRNNFRLQLTDRVGQRLSSCGDLELGLAIKLAGWKLHIEPRLELQHYMPEARLRWRYLRRLLRGVGKSNVVLDSYFYIAEPYLPGLKNRLRLRYWWWSFLGEFRRLLNNYSIVTLIKFCLVDMEGEKAAAELEVRIGRLIGLLRLRSRYMTLRHEIAHAPWRRRQSPLWDLNGCPGG